MQHVKPEGASCHSNGVATVTVMAVVVSGGDLRCNVCAVSDD